MSWARRLNVEYWMFYPIWCGFCEKKHKKKLTHWLCELQFINIHIACVFLQWAPLVALTYGTKATFQLVSTTEKHTQTSYQRVSGSHCKKHRTNWCKSILKRTAGHRYIVGVRPFLKSTPGISAIIGLHRQKSDKAWNQAHTCRTHTHSEREKKSVTYMNICTNVGHIVQRYHHEKTSKKPNSLSLAYIANEFDWFRTIYPFVCDWNHIQGTQSFNMFRKNAHERDARKILMKNYATT